MDSIQLFRTIAFFIYIVLGIYVIYKNPKSLNNRLTGIILFCFSFWSLSMIFYDGRILTKGLAIYILNIGSFGWILLPPFVLLAIVSVTRYIQHIPRKWLLACIFIIPLMLLYVQWTELLLMDVVEESGILVRRWTGTFWSSLHFINTITLFSLSSLLSLIFMIKTKNALRRKQLGLILSTGIVITVLAITFDILLPSLKIKTPINNCGDLMLTFIALSMVYSMIKYRFLTLSLSTAAKDIVSTMPDALFLLNRDGTIALINKQTEQLLGYREQELIELSMRNLLPANVRGEKIFNELLSDCNFTNRSLELKTSSGHGLPVNISRSLLKDDKGEYIGIVCVATDMSEHRRVLKVLRESKERYMALFDRSLDGVFLCDFEGNFIDSNQVMRDVLGYTSEEFDRINFFSLIHQDTENYQLQKIKEIFRSGGQKEIIEVKLCATEDRRIWIGFQSSIIYQDGKPYAIQVVARDISYRKKAEKDLLLVKDSAIASSLNAIVLVSLRGDLEYVNKSFLSMWGFADEEDVLGKSIVEFFQDNATGEKLLEEIKSTGKWFGEITGLRKNETLFYTQLSASIVKGDDPEPICIMASIVDISELMRVKTAMQKREAKYRSIIDNLGELLMTVDDKGDILFVNALVENYTGSGQSESIGRNFLDFVHPEDHEIFKTTLESIPSINHEDKNLHDNADSEFRLVKKDGTIVWIEISFRPYFDYSARIVGFSGIARDITKRKKAEDLLRSSESRYRLIADNATDIIWTADMDLRVTYISPAIRAFGYTTDEIIGKPITEFTTPESQKSALEIFTEDYDRVIRNINTENKRGIRSFTYKQYRKDGSQVWAEARTSFLRDDVNMPIGILGVTRDISERKKAEEEINQSFSKLRQSLNGTVQAMSHAVEVRDPYTAGHQRRVTDLARSIAIEMGINKEKIEGIRIAGIIHDLGKISVPASILSKPGKLIDHEFSLIQIHPQVGYDILKNIDFPWPVADIVHQHHERIDGSGYPLGLVRDDILIQSKILSVADVVEAMASHRPYRASLGIEQALGEITKNKGTLYEPDVVEACLNLFSEKRYQLKEIRN